MADVDYGFFLSGGVDSCIVSHDLLPLYRQEREKLGDDRPIPTYTVGMENSPDVMAARAMVEALGGSKNITHNVRAFTPDEVTRSRSKYSFPYKVSNLTPIPTCWL